MSLARTLRKIALATALSAGALSLVGCGGGEDPKTAKIAAAPMPDGESWTGVYFHPVFGYLHLQEEGTSIVGRWKRTDQSHWGELSGTVRDNLFRYTWKEHKIGMIGPSATTTGKGYFVYKVNESSGIPELDGEFGLKDSEVGSSWKNVKQQRMEPDLKSIGGDGEGIAPNQL